MIRIEHDHLLVSFPDLSPRASLKIGLQRTLRLPDDNQAYPLPPSLGQFPLKHVDDYASKLPAAWSEHGGAFFPMWQSEALWLNFTSNGYPFAVKIAAGKVNAVDGEDWTNELRTHRAGDVPQDYVVTPVQRWLDGFNVGQGRIRQFVAMPLGQGYTAEEQVTGKAEHGGIQIIVYPMKKEAFDAWQAQQDAERRPRSRLVASSASFGGVLRSMNAKGLSASSESMELCASASAAPDMGLAAGGLMTQEIYRDTFGIDVWDTTRGERCFVHITNSEGYQAITGEQPPTKAPLAKDYARHNLPWFDYYADHEALPGSNTLAKLDSVAALGIKKQETPLPDNTSVTVTSTVKLGGSKGVRNGAW